MEEKGGLYVHTPFCRKKCRYCDFYSVTDLSLEPLFIHALKKEIRQKASEGISFDTLYFGGGTPSLLSLDHLAGLLEEIFAWFHFQENPEITIEVNPGTVTRDQLDSYSQMGIRRLTIGVQSFTDKALRFLGRSHTAEDAIRAVDYARAAGFDNIGLDLIFGLPGEEKKSLKANLECALTFSPEHLSCYMLTYEPGTPLFNMRKTGKIAALEEETVGDLYEFLSEFLENRGYDPYEISNFAKINSILSNSINFRSKHNQKYWRHAPYIGLGPAAHSFIRPKRFWNVRSLAAYIEALAEERSPVMEEEILTPEQERMEAVALCLRTKEGIGFDDFRKRFGIDAKQIFERETMSLKAAGYLFDDDERLRLTRKGFLIADAVSLRLIEALDRV